MGQSDFHPVPTASDGSSGFIVDTHYPFGAYFQNDIMSYTLRSARDLGPPLQQERAGATMIASAFSPLIGRSKK